MKLIFVGILFLLLVQLSACGGQEVVGWPESDDDIVGDDDTDDDDDDNDDDDDDLVAVDLGSLSTFVAVAGAGLSNSNSSGITTLNGDAGLYPSATCMGDGSPCTLTNPVINGSLYANDPSGGRSRASQPEKYIYHLPVAELTGILGKPFKIDELLSAVSKCIERQINSF